LAFDPQEALMADAITMLKDDHKKVEKLFKEYEATTSRATTTRQKIVDSLTEELSVHAAVEEQVLYPVARALSDEADGQALESLEEHHLVKVTLQELQKLDPEDERFHPKVTVLIENVRHHVEEEEGTLFPILRAAFGRNDMAEMGDAIVAARRVAPTRPHPGAPDEPPANLVVGAVAGLVDRVRDKAGI